MFAEVFGADCLLGESAIVPIRPITPNIGFESVVLICPVFLFLLGIGDVIVRHRKIDRVRSAQPGHRLDMQMLLLLTQRLGLQLTYT